MTMTNNAAQTVLTDEEILEAMLYGQSDARMIQNGRAIEEAVLSRPRAPVADERQALEHMANEWADMACNAIVWVRNIKDGISTPDEALENLMVNVKHCRDTQARAALASAPVAQQAGPCASCSGTGLDGDVGHDGSTIDVECAGCRGTGTQPSASAAPQASAEAFDFVAHLARQAEFSALTFGPGARVAGVCDHIRKELAEVEASGGDLKEWTDVIILALDGAWRSGATPQEIITAIVAKQAKNEARTWPDWRTVDPNKAIEHQRNAAPCSCPSGDGSLRWPCAAHPQENGDAHE